MTQSLGQTFAAEFKATFGRTLSESESAAYMDAIRAACQPSQAEVRHALNTLGEKHADAAHGHMPTAPQIVREIKINRASRGTSAGEESFDDAVCAIAAEPDLDARWSMICNRGASDALLGTLDRNRIDFRPWNKAHPLFAWQIALLRDPECCGARHALYEAFRHNRPQNESRGEYLRRRDAYAKKDFAILVDFAHRRSAEGWIPPPEKEASGPLSVVVESIEI